MEVTNILNAINIISEKIFKSVEKEVFKGIDDLLLINEDILYKEPLKSLYIKGETKGLILLTTAFVIFFFVYYLLTRFIAMYNGDDTENIFKYMLRIIICVICSSSSIFIIEQVLSLNGILTSAIASIGEDLTKEKICFENLREIIINLDKYMSSDAISVDGVIKGVISFGATTILISFAIRYVTIIFLILVSPISIMFASSSSTYGIFKNWVKMFLINLFVQEIALIVLMIPLSIKGTKDDIFKIILVGSIYILYKINNFTRDFMGTISEHIIRR